MDETEACCTCAALLLSISLTQDEKTERRGARLDCCGRFICGRCTADNPRFQRVCVYCQVSTEPTPLPQGLRDPPPYSLSVERRDSVSSSGITELPSYSSVVGQAVRRPDKSAKAEEAAEDVLHFVDAAQDSIRSLALRYDVPVDALRRKNGVWQDHLLAGRRTVLIPGEFYKSGVSLSPRPIEGEEEELRKSKIRKFMLACKVHEYDVAELYLKQTDYDLELAIQAHREDEEWAEKNPWTAHKKAKQAVRRNRTPRVASDFAAHLT